MQKTPSHARHTEQIEAHGLKALRLRAGGAEALLYLHGAQVASFHRPEHGELLWMSEKAGYAAGKAIRGGVPICFPWFGAHPVRSELPAHGFARTRAFHFEGSEEHGDQVVAELTLSSSPETRELFPYEFGARLRVGVGRELSLAFEVENAGDEAFDYELALHTYLGVSDVRQVKLSGLEGQTYDDKVRGARGVTSGNGALGFDAETDRVYASAARVTLLDPGLNRRLVIDQTGSSRTVVWNPWVAKAARMSDFGDDEWPHMLCVEAANARPGQVPLAPGARHVTSTTISAEAL